MGKRYKELKDIKTYIVFPPSGQQKCDVCFSNAQRLSAGPWNSLSE